MRRIALALLLLASTSLALAQYPGQVPAGNLPQPPSFGNRMPQSPLSPYLNLFAGTGLNPAASYYNFTRPMFQQPQAMSPFASPFNQNPGAFQQQSGFLPPAMPIMTGREYLAPAEVTGPNQLPPTGHPTVFGNRTNQAPPRGNAFGSTGTAGSPSGGVGAAPSKTIPRAKQ